MARARGSGRPWDAAGLAVAATFWLLAWTPATSVRGAEVLLLLSGNHAPYRTAESALRAGLEMRGHSTRTATLEDLAGSGGPAALRSVAACVAVGSRAARWLSGHRSPELPAIFCMVSDPRALGSGPNAAFPGIVTQVPLDEQLRLMREAFPGARSIGMFYRPGSERSREAVESARGSMPPGWILEAVPVESPGTFVGAQKEVFQRDVDLVWTLPDSRIFDKPAVRSLLREAMRRKVPVFGFSVPFVKAGALMGVGVDPRAQGEQAAAMAHLALEAERGRTAGPAPNGPLTLSPAFEIAVNLVVAERLGIELPPSVLHRVDHFFPEPES